MKNTKQQELEETLAKVLPDYMPKDKAWYLDTRAKRLIKVEVVEALTKYSAVDEPEDSTLKINIFYECKTSIGNLAIAQNDMIKDYKTAALALGKLLID